MCRECRADPSKARPASRSRQLDADGRSIARTAGRKGRRWRQLRDQVIAEETHCFRCGLEVDKSLSPRKPMSPSVDHKVDLSAGGDPYDRANVALSHYGCNSRAGGLARQARQCGEKPAVDAGYLSVVIRAGDRKKSLEGVRDFYARLIDDTETAPRDAIAAGRELRAVLAELDSLNQSSKPKAVGGVLDLSARIAERRGQTAG